MFERGFQIAVPSLAIWHGRVQAPRRTPHLIGALGRVRRRRFFEASVRGCDRRSATTRGPEAERNDRSLDVPFEASVPDEDAGWFGKECSLDPVDHDGPTSWAAPNWSNAGKFAERCAVAVTLTHRVDAHAVHDSAPLPSGKCHRCTKSPSSLLCSQATSVLAPTRLCHRARIVFPVQRPKKRPEKGAAPVPAYA